MAKVTIKKLSIRNFNGIATLDLDFSEGTTQFVSPSGQGKSSVIQAVQYACGVDIPKIYPSIDEFIIKDLETKVVLTIDVDGLEYSLERSNKQKWVVDKLTGVKVFKGNESECVFDGEPTSITLYKSKVCSLFNVDADLMPLLLDVGAFNNLHWEAQRKILSKLLKLDEVVVELNQSAEFNLLAEDLAKGKSEVDIQRILNTSKKAINDEVESNRILIEDKATQVAELSKIDYEAIENKKAQLAQERNTLIEQNKEANKNNIIEEKKLELEKLRADYLQKERELNNEKNAHTQKEYELQRKIADLDMAINYAEQRIKKIDSEIEDCTMEETAITEEEFDKSKTICPTCKRELEKDKIDELLLNFQNQRENRLADIKSKASNLAIDKENTQSRINTQKEEKSALEGQLNALKEIKFDCSEVETLKEQGIALSKEIESLKEKQIESVVAEKIKQLNADYDECVRELTNKDQMTKIQNQIDVLKARSRELAVQDQNRILKQDQLFAYIKKKIELVNNTVNQNFEGVKFIFFTPLTSNAEKPYEITCTVSYEGVKYQKCSTGQKILANCRVFDGITKLLNLDMFKFVDERQSTTLNLGLSGQVIEMVTSDDKEKCNFRPVQIRDLYTIDDTDKKNF